MYFVCVWRRKLGAVSLKLKKPTLILIKMMKGSLSFRLSFQGIRWA